MRANISIAILHHRALLCWILIRLEGFYPVSFKKFEIVSKNRCFFSEFREWFSWKKFTGFIFANFWFLGFIFANLGKIRPAKIFTTKVQVCYFCNMMHNKTFIYFNRMIFANGCFKKFRTYLFSRSEGLWMKIDCSGKMYSRNFNLKNKNILI